MKIGIARVSTEEQEAGLADQIRELRAAGCERVIEERVSAVGARPDLDSVLAGLAAGDMLVVTKLDRLARSVVHLGKILDQLNEKKVALSILAIGLDTSTAIGKLMLNVMASVAQFEREMMLERQRAGIDKARADGKYKGRAVTATHDTKAALVAELLARNVGKVQIMEAVEISESSYQRIKRRLRAA